MRHRAAAVGFLILACSRSALGAQGVVDDKRLLGVDADSANWLNHGRDYGNQRL